jgi:hypothetical protein
VPNRLRLGPFKIIIVAVIVRPDPSPRGGGLDSV